MEALILFLLAAAGMTHVVVDSTVADPFRRLMKWTSKNLLLLLEPLPKDVWYTKTLQWLAVVPSEVVDCHQCSGFWCGVICGYILICHNLWSVIMCGFASSITALFAAYVFTYLQAKSIIEMGPLPDKDK